MPGTCCCVPECHQRGGHEFPTNTKRRELWIHAVRRVENNQRKWAPSKSSVVCHLHFTESDYIAETVTGMKPLVNRLKQTAVPSLFPWTESESRSAADRKIRAQERDAKKRNGDNICRDELEVSFNENVQFMEEEIQSEDTLYATPVFDEFSECSTSTQTDTLPMMSIDMFSKDDAAVHFYTGLESYGKFMFVLNILGPAAYHLKYIYFNVTSISVPDQLFMTLMKLRRCTTNFELSRFFAVSESCVINIVYTWIKFMALQLHEINIWPCQSLVRYFSPSDFKKKFPTTRVIVDGTECPIKKPKAPTAQQATFSSYKNRNTAKVLIGSTPGGLVNYISEAYGGSTSDRQIVERGSLIKSCDPGDSVMADKGFNVQDLFATRNVSVNIPTFFSKKNRMSGKVVLRDRKISSKRVHIERIIGLGKSYKILTNPLTSTETKLASDIIFICFMLCNFRSCIVSKHA